MGLDVYLYIKDSKTGYVKRLGMPSKKYPDLLFEIGYFRSSYNSFGINRLLNINFDTEIGKLFGFDEESEIEFKDGPKEDDYIPLCEINWQCSLDNLKELYEKMSTAEMYYYNINIGSTLSFNEMISKTEYETKTEMNNLIKKERSGPYADSDLSICGYTIMTKKLFNIMRLHVMELIKDRVYNFGLVAGLKVDDDYRYYLKCIEVMMETCKYVLTEQNPKECYLYFST
jgi:hypothetical protein